MDLLDQQVKNNGLNESNMDQETKQALAEAKTNPTPENIAKAEDKVAQNGVDNKLKDLITQIENKLKSGNLTPKEKSEIATILLSYTISKNKYQKQAYEKLKDKVDSLLSELGRENNQEKPGIS